MGGKFEDSCFMARHIGSLWETAGVSLIVMFQMKYLATKLFPSWTGQAPELSCTFILAETHRVHFCLIAIFVPLVGVGLLKVMISAPPSAVPPWCLSFALDKFGQSGC